MPLSTHFHTRALLGGTILLAATGWAPLTADHQRAAVLVNSSLPAHSHPRQQSASADGSLKTPEPLRSEGERLARRFAARFSDFRYTYGERVRTSDEFLRARAGDCDDYAVLAASVFSRHGYRTELLSIRVREAVHVVCHLPEAGGYLDFNHRSDGDGLTRCGSDWKEIADRVAVDFSSAWISVTAFTHSGGLKRLAPGTRPLLASDLPSSHSP